MNRDDDGGPIAGIVLERYRLNELPSAQAERLERRLREDAPLRARLQALEASDAELLSDVRFRQLAAHVRARAAAHPEPARARALKALRPWPVTLALVTAVIVLVMVIPRTAGPPTAETDRIKGLEPALSIFRRSGSCSETLADGAVARAGDLIRIGYGAAGRPYGVIVSIDGRGNVTRHLPTSGELAAALRTDPTVLLDHAYELDDAPRWERFYLITGESPFPVAPVLDAARAAASLARGGVPPMLVVSHDLEQTAFSLQKKDRP